MIKEQIQMLNNLDQNTNRKGILEGAEDTYWEWLGTPTTLGKLSNKQLLIVKRSVKNYSNRDLWFENKEDNNSGIRSSDVLTNIDIIFDYRKKDPDRYLYEYISENQNKKFYKTAEIFCKVLMPHIKKKLSPDLRDSRKVNS